MSIDAESGCCPACGAELPPLGQRCISCGAALAQVLAGEAEEAAVANPAEQAAGSALPVGIAPRGPWQDGTALGLDSDAPAGGPSPDQPLDETRLPPEVLAILKAPPVKASKLAGLPELGGGLTWPRVIGCLIAMLLLAGLALAMLYMLKAARQAQSKIAAEQELREELQRGADPEAVPDAALDPGNPDEPAPVQPRQGGPDAGAAENAVEAGTDAGEGSGSGDSLF